MSHASSCLGDFLQGAMVQSLLLFLFIESMPALQPGAD